MLGHGIYYHETMRKMIVAFGAIFQGMKIQRVNHQTKVVQKEILVPLYYGPKNKWIYRILQNPKLDQDNVALIIPKMSFDFVGLMYDPERKLQSTVTNSYYTSGNAAKGQQYVPVPYDFNFNLFIITDLAEDAARILEQIVTFFSPEFTVTVNSVPEMDLSNDCPIILNGISREDNYETDLEDKRLIVWTLDFTMKGWIYGPVSDAHIIRKVIADMYTPASMSAEDRAAVPRSVRILTVPDPSDANPDEEFTIVQTITEYNDNKRFDPTTGEDKEIEGSD